MTSKALRILAFAHNPWQGSWMNRQQILSRLAGRHRVIYTNGPWQVWDRNQPEWRRAPRWGEFQQLDGVWVDMPPKWLLAWPSVTAVDRLALAAAARRWRRQLNFLGRGPTVGYVFHPKFQPHLEALMPDYCVYHAFDLFRQGGGWNESKAQAQQMLLERADLVLGSSEVIAAELAAVSGRVDIKVLPNGADAELFAAGPDLPEPADLAAVHRPRIGYTGNLNRKVDFALVAELAGARPEWQVVFVGGVGNLDAAAEQGLARCQALPNVHFLGHKDHRDLPAYIGHMDVNIMCYRMGADLWTEGIYPLKLHEYLAAGLPVVGADLPSVRPFRKVVDIARDVDEWMAAIETALTEGGYGSPDERRVVAFNNSWDQRVITLNNYLSEMTGVEV